MVNMEFVHGLERAIEIINAEIRVIELKMAEYENTVSAFPSGSLFYQAMIMDYAKMYSEQSHLSSELYLMVTEMKYEIEKLMSADNHEDNEIHGNHDVGVV